MNTSTPSPRVSKSNVRDLVEALCKDRGWPHPVTASGVLGAVTGGRKEGSGFPLA